MRVLVTGAEGFVGSRLVPHLAEAGHRVVAAIRSGATRPAHLAAAEAVRPFDLDDAESVAAVVSADLDGVIHLAGWSAPGGETADRAGVAYAVNVAGTARLAETVARTVSDGHHPRFLHVSSGLVYGGEGTEPFAEDASLGPRGVYAGSKLASEIAVLEVHRRTGLEVVVARAFTHTGAGQDERFVVPAFARRIRDAERIGAAAIGVGNLAPIRDILHVADVVEAYRVLLEGGRAGDVYNVASGTGITIRDLFLLVADVVGYRVVPEVDTVFVRAGDAPYMVGDAGKLRRELQWAPRRSLAEAVQEVVDAQAN